MTLQDETLNLSTRASSSNIAHQLEEAAARIARQEKLQNDAFTSRISSYEDQGSMLSQKEGLQPPTDRNLQQFGNATRSTTSDCYSNATIGLQFASGNAIQTGLKDPTLYVLSESLSRKLGLPTESQERKQVPLWSGLVKYFPDALAAVAAVSYQGSKQHHPEKALHWDRSKSTDHEDCLLRHQWESGTVDTDGHRHAAKVAWRALAILQLELEGSK